MAETQKKNVPTTWEKVREALLISKYSKGTTRSHIYKSIGDAHPSTSVASVRRIIATAFNDGRLVHGKSNARFLLTRKGRKVNREKKKSVAKKPKKKTTPPPLLIEDTKTDIVYVGIEGQPGKIVTSKRMVSYCSQTLKNMIEGDGGTNSISVRLPCTESIQFITMYLMSGNIDCSLPCVNPNNFVSVLRNAECLMLHDEVFTALARLFRKHQREIIRGQTFNADYFSKEALERLLPEKFDTMIKDMKHHAKIWQATLLYWCRNSENNNVEISFDSLINALHLKEFTVSPKSHIVSDSDSESDVALKTFTF